ncbi:MAG: type VI secretion system lipoprotein TssJ [Candidatus Competibacteraceae bacterium]
MRRRGFIYWLVLLLVGLMGGCGSSKPPLLSAVGPPPPPPLPPPTRVVMEVAASADLNPNLLNQPSPLQLRIYELKTPGVFDRADFFTLYEQEKTVLGADLLAQEQKLIKPGAVQRLQRTLQAETRYLGFLAAYRDIDRAQWRTIIAVPPNQTTTIKVNLQRLGLIARAIGR